jgi:hypothetical protein
MSVATLPSLPALRESAKEMAREYRAMVLVPTGADAMALESRAEMVGGAAGAGMLFAASSWWSEIGNYPAAMRCDHRRDRMLSDAVIDAVRQWGDAFFAVVAPKIPAPAQDHNLLATEKFCR